MKSTIAAVLVVCVHACHAASDSMTPSSSSPHSVVQDSLHEIRGGGSTTTRAARKAEAAKKRKQEQQRKRKKTGKNGPDLEQVLKDAASATKDAASATGEVLGDAASQTWDVSKRVTHATADQIGAATSSIRDHMRDFLDEHEAVGPFLTWVAPLLLTAYGLPVLKAMEQVLNKAMVKPQDHLPTFLQLLSRDQILKLMDHVKWAVPSVVLSQVASLFLFPLHKVSQSTKWAALFQMATVPVFLASAAYLLASLSLIPLTIGSGEAAVYLGMLVKAVAILAVVLPSLPFLTWTVEFAGRRLKDAPDDLFLPDVILWASAKVNAVFSGTSICSALNQRLFESEAVRKLLPDSWCDRSMDSWNQLEVASECAKPSAAFDLSSLWDRNGKNKKNKLKRTPPKRLNDAQLVDIQKSLTVTLLYGLLTGMTLFGALTHGGFSGISYRTPWMATTATSVMQATKDVSAWTVTSIAVLAWLASIAVGWISGVAILDSYDETTTRRRRR